MLFSFILSIVETLYAKILKYLAIKTAHPPSALLEKSRSATLVEDDSSFWSQILTPQLSTLLSAAKYPAHDSLVQSISTFLQDFRSLGPKPSSSKAPWPSFLSDDHSPIEYSLSIAPDRMIVRFAFEPISRASGTLEDPFNTTTTTDWLDEVVKKYPYDLTWYKTLRQHLMIDPSTLSSSNSPNLNLEQPEEKLTQQVFAFDLEGPIPRLKIYIMPDALVRISPPSQRVSQRDALITSALSATGLGEAWALIRSYLADLHMRKPENAGYVEALGWDACAPKKARQKAYVRFQSAGISDVLAHLDLGGRLKGEVFSEIQEAATEMWGAFVGGDMEGEKEKGLGFGSIEDLKDRTGGALLAYELREGSNEPVCVKFYFPVRYHFASDFTLAKRIDAFLVAKMGREPGWYLTMMEQYCTHRKLDSRTGIQTFVGGTVRRGVWDLTVYIGPEGYASERDGGN